MQRMKTNLVEVDKGEVWIISGQPKSGVSKTSSHDWTDRFRNQGQFSEFRSVCGGDQPCDI